MTTTQLKKTVVAALLSGSIALAGLGLTAGVAQAQPDGPPLYGIHVSTTLQSEPS